mgnify:CR=1 FL=1
MSGPPNRSADRGAHDLGLDFEPHHSPRRARRPVLAVVNKHLKHRIKLISERDRRVVIVNAGGGKSELRAKSADNSDSLLGEGLDYVVVDEAARLNADIWHEHLSQRLLDRHGRALLISTPNGFDWFARLHRRGQRGRDPEFASWSGASWRNPGIDRALIEQERERLDAAAFGALYGGEFVGEDPFPCDVCHGPDPNAIGMVVLQEHELLAECRECGKPVDNKGHTLVRRETNGMQVFQSITLIHREGCEVHLPPGKAGERGVLIEAGDRAGMVFEVDG